jgi:hypothetical protein
VVTFRWPDRKTLNPLGNFTYYFVFPEIQATFVKYFIHLSESQMKDQQTSSKGIPPARLLQRLMKPAEHTINATRQTKINSQKISDRVLSHTDIKKKY